MLHTLSTFIFLQGLSFSQSPQHEISTSILMPGDIVDFQPEPKRCPQCPEENTFWDQHAARKHWKRVHKEIPIIELENSLKLQTQDCPFCWKKESRKLIISAFI